MKRFLICFMSTGAEISITGGLVNEYLEPRVYDYLFNSNKFQVDYIFVSYEQMLIEK